MLLNKDEFLYKYKGNKTKATSSNVFVQCKEYRN